MLKDMREGMKPVMWVVAIAFVGATFLWGASTGISILRERKLNTVAEVGSKTVNVDEFMEYLTMDYLISKAQYEQTYGRLTPEMEQELLLNSARKTSETLIHMKLLMQEAEKLGLVVTDEEVRKYIRRSTFFHDEEGNFDYSLYEQIVGNFFYSTPAFFEEQIRREILASNLVDLILTSARFTDQDISDIYLRGKETADIALIAFPAKDYMDQVSVKSLDLEKYFQEHGKRYYLPRQAKIRYIFVDLNRMEKQVTITEEMLRSFYEEHKSDYAMAGLVHLRIILIEVPSDATPAQKDAARKKAQDIIAELSAGEDFSKLASQYSDDSYTAEQGGDMGFVPLGMTGDEELDKVLMNLDEGEFTKEPVETLQGFHIFYRDADIPRFEDEREQIEKKLTKMKAEETARIRAYEILQALSGGRDIDGIATELGIEARSTEYFGDDGVIKEIGSKPQLAAEVFQLEQVGDVGKVYENYEYSPLIPQPVLTGYYVYLLEDFKEAHLPEFEEVKEQVSEDAKLDAALNLARKDAERLLSKVGDSSIDSLAKTAGLEVERITGITRQKGIDGVGNYKELLDWVFEGEIGSPSPVLESPAGAYIITVENRTTPSDAEISAEAYNVLPTSLREFSTKLYHDYYISLRKTANILIAPEEILGIFGAGPEEESTQIPPGILGF